MTRAELEAVVWRNGPTTPAQVDAILQAADEYATRFYPREPAAVTERRRAILASALYEPRIKAVQ